MKSFLFSTLIFLSGVANAAAPVCDIQLQKLDGVLAVDAAGVDAKSLQELGSISHEILNQLNILGPLEGKTVVVAVDQFKPIEDLQIRSSLLVENIYGESGRLQTGVEEWWADFEKCPELAGVSATKISEWKTAFDLIQMDSRINEAQLAAYVDSLAVEMTKKLEKYLPLEGQTAAFYLGEFHFVDKWHVDSGMVGDFYKDLSAYQIERLNDHSELLRQILSE